jgi:uncharacterized protein (TIGR00251 family)
MFITLPDSPLSPARDGLRVAIRLTPRAKADRVLAVATATEGRQVVRASVTAAPENGRANEALLQLLARAWRLPRRELAIVAGGGSRHKTVHIAGDPRQLLDRLSALIAALPGP